MYTDICETSLAKDRTRSEWGLLGHITNTIVTGPLFAVIIWLILTGLGAHFDVHWPTTAVVISTLIGVGTFLLCVIGTVDAFTRHRIRFHQTTPEKRARALLLKLLTPEQQRQYLMGQPIKVPLHDKYGNNFGNAYIGRTINGVQWATSRTNRQDAAWYEKTQCVNVTGNLAKEDDIIAKLLWLRTNPEGLAVVSKIRLQ